ncbi:hypothetical protein F511_30782 [Dorcoceras hygrometricum]|uniref:Uncharacterized protein n=1 Tax=Dorcoceras hygrometricum TaxID=472368 RepID=A0A2Z7AFZ4_9LAMI|nr:hypothetical protein F511_30782 [Dorcoceras hygrometricum]
MTFRVVRTNQYNQDLGLIHSTNGNHLESPNEGSSIDHQSIKPTRHKLASWASTLTTTGRAPQPVQAVSQSYQSPQGSQQSSRQQFRPRGKQFKKKGHSSSSGSREFWFWQRFRQWFWRWILWAVRRET